MFRTLYFAAIAVALCAPPLVASSFGQQQPHQLPSIADIVERVGPSVVNIVSEARPKRAGLSPLELFFGMHGRNNVIPRRGEGSGFIIDAKGLILTSHHVVEGASTL